MKKLTTRQIALNGVVAGLYAAITILTASFAYGNIQFRIADSLCVLVVLEPSLTVGLTLGCLISNIFSTVSALDIVIGTAGTLLGCLLAARVKKDWLVPVPVILANAVLVGAMLAYVLTPDEHLGLPDIDDVREGVIATRIAAHAADIAKGLPQAIAWDREMAVARKNLDWPEQIRLALDPVKAQAYRDKKNKAEDEACSMCGDYCAVKIVGQYLEAHRKKQ